MMFSMFSEISLNYFPIMLVATTYVQICVHIQFCFIAEEILSPTALLESIDLVITTVWRETLAVGNVGEFSE